MGKATRIVAGLTHIDIGWKKGQSEMAELFDIFLVYLIDLIKQNRNFHYLLEQAFHFRELKIRRPDLFEKVCSLVKDSNLEFATGLASTIETNVTNGEAFVRNMQIGCKWIEENFGVAVKNCTMIDTFGFPPQMPQVLQQFGFPHLLANRFGGEHIEDVFWAEGLDGTKILVVGRDNQTPSVKDGHIAFQFYMKRKELDLLFKNADKNENTPLLVIPYTENEVVPLAYMIELMENSKQEYSFGTLEEYFKQLMSAEENWKTVSADLNPEFTGTFSLRQKLRTINRAAEQYLLEAEKLLAIFEKTKYITELENNWWEMSYTQFHDIITGSHPTEVYLNCLERFQAIINSSNDLIRKSIQGSNENINEKDFIYYTIWNGLPRKVNKDLTFLLPENWEGIEYIEVDEEKRIGYKSSQNNVSLMIDIAAMSTCVVRIKKGFDKRTIKAEKINKLENEYYLIEFGQGYLIREMIYKPTGQILMKCIDDLLILQEDHGNYQIESPFGSEMKCGVGDYTINLYQEGDIQFCVIDGSFPNIKDNEVKYKMKFSLKKGDQYLDAKVEIDWKAEASRLRLKLSTELGATENCYEVPFGVVNRKPYGTRATAKGEWAAQRFVAMENEKSNIGIALMNRGIVGVETGNGILKTTLLRAPVKEYAGMVVDDTSSDHGQHEFDFRLMAYSGSWKDNKISVYAQEFNQICPMLQNVSNKIDSLFDYDNDNIILSAIKITQQGLIAIRMYETTGRMSKCNVKLPKTERVWNSDLKEVPLEELIMENQLLELNFQPFEIKTLLLNKLK